ncbi:MAG: methyl-accepting chemotaxis protein [Gammaproteobacteria bacterium]|nr:methyl-accepting chemotaxis protein [Gammaproteobacteria bacterium]
MKKNFPITGNENNFPSDVHIVSTTDTKGTLTSFNQDFLDVSGFTSEELMGKNHNVVRHPDMPPAAFADLWNVIKPGNPWMGVVKNRCKNGDHYWVDAYVTPCIEGVQTVGYQSVRNKPERKHVERAEQLYEQLNNGTSLWQRLKSKCRFGLLGKIYTGYALAFLPVLISALVGEYVLASVALGAVVGLVAGKLVAHPWQQAAQQSRETFANTVAQQVYTGRADELGQLQLVLRAQQARLRTVVWCIDAAASQLDEIANGTAAVVEQSNQGIHQQQSEIDQVATAMNEMSTVVREVARNTAQAAEAAHEAEGVANNGAQAAADSIRGIDKLVDDVEQAATVIKQLERESDSIGSVLDVIRGIAEQTNLLALNAAIEAARAGEAGRGFAVVADEVRTLASRTQQSTEEIQRMIEGLQSGAQQAVLAMDKAQGGAKASSKQVENLAESLTNVSSAVNAINEMNMQIATAAEEQTAVSEEINRNIVNISTLAEQTTVASTETTHATENLAQEAGQLRAVVRQFGDE